MMFRDPNGREIASTPTETNPSKMTFYGYLANYTGQTLSAKKLAAVKSAISRGLKEAYADYDLDVKLSSETMLIDGHRATLIELKDDFTEKFGNIGVVGYTPGRAKHEFRGDDTIQLGLNVFDPNHPESFGRTAAHELGHLMGFDHEQRPGMLMTQTRYGGGWALTDRQKEGMEHIRTRVEIRRAVNDMLRDLK